MAQMIDHQIINTSFNLDIIIAGVDDDGAHLYGIRDPGVADCFDSLGFHAIGIGALHALSTLALTYDPNVKQEDMVKRIHSIKKSTEVAPGVGEMTDISIITENGIEDVDLKELEEAGGK